MQNIFRTIEKVIIIICITIENKLIKLDILVYNVKMNLK